MEIPVPLSTSALLAFPRHYPALKTLEHLEHTYLPQVSHYRFCKIMVDNIPKLREEIKEVSMSDLKDFLESIRKHSDKIGETAMKQVGLVCAHTVEAFCRGGWFTVPLQFCLSDPKAVNLVLNIELILLLGEAMIRHSVVAAGGFLF